MDSLKLYNVKKELDQKYSGYTRDDLLWILALSTLSTNIQKATFSGPFSMYLSTFNDKAIRIRQLLIDAGCNAMTQFNFQDYSGAGSSNASLYTANIEDLPVMLKRKSIDPDDPIDDAGVIYEGLVYKHFFKYMQENNITPNIPYFYDFKLCEKSPFEAFTELYSENMAGTVLIKGLAQYQVNDKIPITVWRPLLFQIIYTLMCFQEVNLRHNDLHTGNIYINPGIKGTIKYYVEPNVFYTVSLDSVGLIKIFDMDVSSVDCTNVMFRAFKNDLNAFKVSTRQCDNPKTLTMSEYGIAPRGRSLFDLFVTLCTILKGNYNHVGGYESVMDPVTRQFIERVFSQADIDDPAMVFHCRSVKVNNNPDNYKKLNELINDPYFTFMKNIEVDDAVSFHLPSVKISS